MKGNYIMNNTIGKNIKAYRINAKMTQKDLANELFVTQVAVQQWEKGKKIPSADNIIRLANIFNISPNFIYYDNIDTFCHVSFAESYIKKHFEEFTDLDISLIKLEKEKNLIFPDWYISKEPICYAYMCTELQYKHLIDIHQLHPNWSIYKCVDYLDVLIDWSHLI